MAVCEAKYPDLICRPVATQVIDEDLIALFEFGRTDAGIRVTSEKHYRLVSIEELTFEELESYRQRSE